MSHKIMATLVHFERLGDRYAVLRLKPDSNRWTHKPGQYTEIVFAEGPDALIKTYSIASAMRDDGVLDFCVQLSDGVLLATSQTWAVGRSEFMLAPAAGNFHIPAYGKPVVLLAGGSGITPLKALLEDRAYHGGKEVGSTVLLYGCGDDHEIPFYDDLKNLGDQHPETIIVRFFAEHRLHPESGRTEAGRPQAVLDQYLRPDAEFLMCGPPPFLDAIRSFLIKAGIPPENIHQDRY